MNKNALLLLLLGALLPVGLLAQTSPFETRSAQLLEDGQAFFETKNYAAATRYLEEFLGREDEFRTAEQEREAQYCIAMSAFYLRRDDAAKRLAEYQETYPYATGSELMYLYRGILEYEEGKYKQAIKYFDSIKENKLTNEQKQDLHFYKGYCYIRQENYPNAAYEFEQLFRLPNNQYEAPAHYYYGYAEYQLKNYAVAVNHLNQVKNHPDFNETAPYILVQCYYALEDCDQVVACGKPLLDNSKNRNRNEVLRLMAACSFNNKDYTNTLNYYKEYQKSNPKLTREDWYQMGMALYFQGNNPEAIFALSKCTNGKDKMMQNAYFHIAMAYLKQGDKKNARMAFQSASNVDYDKDVREDALYNYALTTYELSYSPFNESVSAFEKFLKEYPNSEYVPKVYEYLTNVYLTTQNYAEAYQSIQNINSPTPSIKAAEQRILFGLATTSIANRNYTAAQNYLETMLQGRSYDAALTARAYYWLGECNYKNEKYSEAKNNYNKYLSLSTNRSEQEFPLVHYALGYTSLQLKNYSDANIWFRKYVNLEKSNNVMLIDAYNRIADCYFVERQYELAYNNYKLAYNQGSDLAGADYAVYRQALIAGLQKNYTTKVNRLEQLVRDYPRSEWTDEARFEIAKTYVALGQNDQAIAAYQQIISSYPKTNPVVRKAQLQIAMLQYNEGDSSAALASYKQVVANYPNSAEATAALSAIEDILVERNQVDQYASIVQSMGVKATSKEDSLLYKAAEKVYFKEQWSEAANSLSNYLVKYPSGKYHSLANYYLANSYYMLQKYDESLATYRKIVNDPGNPNLEFSLVRASAIAYDKGRYEEAAGYFTQLSQMGSSDARQKADLGLMRCNFERKQYRETISAAQNIIRRYASNTEWVSESRYKMMKSYETLGNRDSAFVCMNVLAKDTRTAEGAEAKYLMAEYYHQRGQDDQAEAEIFNFIEKGTPHGHWLAKAFVLLSDIYIARSNYFEAKQYLLSLRENYVKDDLEINNAIASRLATIEKYESEHIFND